MITASLIMFHNKAEDIDKVISSVLKSCIDLLYVIDHSQDDSLRNLIPNTTKIRYTHTDNDGYGSGHNLGFHLSQEIIRSDYHVVLNPDVYFEPEAIARLASFMDKNQQAGMVMPKVFYPNGDFQYLCKLLPTPSDIFFRQFAPAKIKEKNNRRYVMMNADFEKVMIVPSLSGCFMFLRSEVFKKIGGFDTRYFMHFEDIDLTRRIGDISETYYFPNASIIHAHAAAHKQSKKMLMIGLKSAVKYFNKWGWIFDSTRRQRNKVALREYCTEA